LKGSRSSTEAKNLLRLDRRSRDQEFFLALKKSTSWSLELLWN